jgi:dihydrofolate reductase
MNWTSSDGLLEHETSDDGSAGMGKLLWHTMMSLDGFVAGPDDDMSWAFGLDAGSGETVDNVVASTGALLVGRRTQDVEDRLKPGFYGGAFRGPFFVLRHDPPPDPPVVKGVTGRFLDVDMEEAVAIASEAAGDRNVVVLGANIARQCLETGLLDEIIVHVAPILLGDGVRLFERVGGEPVTLGPISSVDEGGTTVLRYAVGPVSAS